MTKKVTVLMGGWSAERDVSLVSGTDCANALERAGYDVTRVDIAREIPVPMWCSTPCMVAGVKMARSRDCWISWPFPIPILGASPLPWR